MALQSKDNDTSLFQAWANSRKGGSESIINIGVDAIGEMLTESSSDVHKQLA
jgi:hypothetical protein